jgi:hypothetical protein
MSVLNPRFLVRRFPLFVAAFTLFAASTPTPQKAEGDVPFQGNRLPGILAAPTEQPTGENAHLYRAIGRLAPDELLDRMSAPGI